MYEITETEDYRGTCVFFSKHGLEEAPDAPTPEGLLKIWEIKKADGTRIAAARLEKRSGEFVVTGISVEPDRRKENLGSALMEAAEGEVKRLGGNRVLLVAKAPGFFRKLGYTTVEKDSIPVISTCSSCPQLDKSCFPKFMVKTVSIAAT